MDSKIIKGWNVALFVGLLCVLPFQQAQAQGAGGSATTVSDKRERAKSIEDSTNTDSGQQAQAQSTGDSTIAASGYRFARIDSNGIVTHTRNFIYDFGRRLLIREEALDDPEFEDIVSIARGRGFVIGLKEDGTVSATGDNYRGQRGIGASGSTFDAPIEGVELFSYGNPDGPKHFLLRSLSSNRVLGLEDVVGIAADYDGSLALKSDGTVWGWGFRNGTPTQVTGLAENAAIVDMDVGGIANIYLDENGQVYTGRSVVKMVDGLANIVSVSAGFGHYMALTDGGDVFVWGLNRLGQLGTGNRIAISTPQQILTGIASIAAGNMHSLVLTEDNRVLQFGQASWRKAAILRPTMVPLNGQLVVKEIAAGQVNIARVENNSRGSQIAVWTDWRQSRRRRRAPPAIHILSN